VGGPQKESGCCVPQKVRTSWSLVQKFLYCDRLFCKAI
jgi:hypothetical protein